MDNRQEDKIKITVLGARGSIPTEGENMLEFGGATSCILAQAGGHALFIDAGTGIMQTPDLGDEKISLLLTHPHLDHIIGLPFFPYISNSEKRIDFYACQSDVLSARGQLDKFFAPPLWPCTIEDYPSTIVIHDIDFPLTIGEFTVDGIPSVHPGGGTVYRVGYKGRSFVYATDYEYMEDRIGELIDFSMDTDLLFFDAQYTDEEFERRKGFGHSTVKQGMEVAKECRAKAVRFVHHDPRHSDEFLRGMEKSVKSETVSFARRGEVIWI